MISRLIFPVLLLTVPMLASADEASHKAAALKLVSKVNSKESMMATFNTMIDTMTKNMATQGVPEPAIKEVKVVVTDWFTKEINFDEIAPKMADNYVQEFSEEEINQIVAFYDTPTGKKLLGKQPALMQKGAALGQEQFKSKQADLQKRVMEILAKYAPGAPGGAALPPQSERAEDCHSPELLS